MSSPNWAALGVTPFEAAAEGSIGEAIEEWRSSDEWENLAPTTRATYSVALRRMIEIFGTVLLREWQPAWGHHYLAQRRSRPAAANLDMKCLSLVFARAVRSGVLVSNPVREVRRLPAKARDRYVTDAELHQFRQHCEPRLGAYVELKLVTGARQGQLIALRWHDWDGDGLHVGAAKHGRATIYEGAAVAEALQRCAIAFYGAMLSTMRPEDAVICTRARRPYRAARYWIEGVWSSAMSRYEAAGGKRFTEHDLRAKVATDAHDLTRAMTLLGHRTSQITEKVYMRGPRRVEGVQQPTIQPDLFEHQATTASGGSIPSTTTPRSPARSPVHQSKAAGASLKKGRNVDPKSARAAIPPRPPSETASAPSLRDDVPRLRGDGPEEASASPVAPARSPSEPSPPARARRHGSPDASRRPAGQGRRARGGPAGEGAR